VVESVHQAADEWERGDADDDHHAVDLERLPIA
jgi:hypothetical protein